MSALSEKEKKDANNKELIQLAMANRLMDEEMKRLQPELAKHDNSSVHPAARAIEADVVSTISVTDKTKSIKRAISNLRVVESDLIALNDKVTNVFKDVEMKVSQRDSLFSDIEQATSDMNALTIGSSHFEDDSGKVKSAALSTSSLLAATTAAFQERMEVKLSKLASLQKAKSELERTIALTMQKMEEVRAKKAEYTSKIDVDSLTMLKAKLEEMKEKTVKLNEHLILVTKDEGERLEALIASITECEMLKKEKAELSQKLDELNAREEKTGTEKEETKKRVEAAQAIIDQLTNKRELLSKDHEILMAERKAQLEPLLESLKIQKETAEKKLEAMQIRVREREECMTLRKELLEVGEVDELDLAAMVAEIESIKQDIEEARASISKSLVDSEHYKTAAANCNAEAEELHKSLIRRREEAAKVLREKNRLADHYENELYLQKKKMEQEKAEHEERLAQETRRLLEKAKEEKERREKEEKRKVEKEKEKIRKVKEEEEKKMKKAKEDREKEEKKKVQKEKEKMRKVKEEEEKKMKREREEREKQEEEKKMREREEGEKQEEEKKMREREEREEQERKKKDEAKNRVTDAAQKKDMAYIPFARDDGAPMRPQYAHAFLPPAVMARPLSHSRKTMIICDDDSSDDDDDDDMDDFLMNGSMRPMPKVPEKYAGTPPRVGRRETSPNPFELSFADVQSSTPLKSQRDPAPVFGLSFSEVVTSTPHAERGSKANKKQTRGRGKRRSK